MPDLSIFKALYGQASTQDTASFRETSGCVDLLWEHWVDTTSAPQSLTTIPTSCHTPNKSNIAAHKLVL